MASRDVDAAASPRWGNGGGSCTCSGYARSGEPAVFDSSRCPVHAKPLPEARSAACPYCGEPKATHEYASPTTCVLGSAPALPAEGRYVESAAKTSPRCEPIAHSNFYFGLRTGAKLELPATDLTARERVDLVASIARAIGLPDVGRHIRDQWWWVS